MGDIEQAVYMANRMYEMRKAAKTLFKDDYKEKVTPYIEIVKNVMMNKELNEVKAVLDIANDNEIRHSEMAVIMLMSAALEISEEKRPH
jgi:hypothetical protein